MSGLQPKTRYPDPLLTISIVSHGDSTRVSRLLESISRYEQAKIIQVIVTDNLNNEVPVLDGSSWSSLLILRNKHSVGFASNHNKAYQFARGKFFCVLNPDVLFEQKVFSALMAMVESGQADIVSPLIVDVNRVVQDSFRNFPTPMEIIMRRLPGYRFTTPAVDAIGLVEPDWIAGIFMLMKSETYRALDGFDEKYHLYFEDVDFCARAKFEGLKLIVNTKLRIQHNAHRASRNKPIYLLWHLNSAIRFFNSPIYKKTIQKSR